MSAFISCIFYAPFRFLFWICFTLFHRLTVVGRVTKVFPATAKLCCRGVFSRTALRFSYARRGKDGYDEISQEIMAHISSLKVRHEDASR